MCCVGPGQQYAVCQQSVRACGDTCSEGKEGHERSQTHGTNCCTHTHTHTHTHRHHRQTHDIAGMVLSLQHEASGRATSMCVCARVYVCLCVCDVIIGHTIGDPHDSVRSRGTAACAFTNQVFHTTHVSTSLFSCACGCVWVSVCACYRCALAYQPSLVHHTCECAFTPAFVYDSTNAIHIYVCLYVSSPHHTCECAHQGSTQGRHESWTSRLRLPC